ncbi:hypothetical protein GCM10007860_26880 [Chitiniphilus shinanonensis]|uniref:Transmembrane protein n=1 Tax=Chitiniphilus shinanonensis TaxID=553088 RepID=A0ABQ6BV31_9NEIS|nr:DUF6404 family protein [Chitiniphilus shinanonensis]GLS05534.1 hypothetical protein GCM10007860_26880 [Chitiniphilus shinanonensis]
MSFQTRLARAQALLTAAGIPESSRAPWLCRVAWRMGVPLRPPHFRSWPGNVIYHAVWFGTVWGGTMWLVIWGPQSMSPRLAVFTAVLTGLLFGVGMAVFYGYQAWRLHLPPWSDLPD